MRKDTQLKDDALKSQGTSVKILGTKGVFADGGKHSRAIVSSLSKNSLHPRLVDFVHSIVPSTELGASIALMDQHKGKILAGIDNKKLAGVKAVNDLIASWALIHTDSRVSDYAPGTLNLGVTKTALLAHNLNEVDLIPLQLIITKTSSVFFDLIMKDFERELVGTMNVGSTLKKFISRLSKESARKIFDDLEYLGSEEDGVNIVNILTSLHGYEHQDDDASNSLRLGGIKTSVIDSSGVIDKRYVTFDLYSFWIESFILSAFNAAAIEGFKTAKPGSKSKTPYFNVFFNSAVDVIRDNSRAIFNCLPYSWDATEASGKSINVFLNKLFSNEVFADKMGQLGMVFYKTLTPIFEEADRNVSKVTGVSYGVLLSTVESLSSFQQSIESFYTDKLSMLHDSYEESDKLMARHKSMMNSLRFITDDVAFKSAILSFTDSDVFKNGLAGLLHALCSVSDEIDRHLLTDVFSFGVSAGMIDVFDKSVFSELASVTRDDVYRITDYGSDVGGFGMTSRIKHKVTIKFLTSGDIQFGDVSYESINKAFSDPASVSVNAMWFKIYAMLMITDPRYRASIGGINKLSSIEDGYSYSKTMRDGVLPMLQLVNNCVASQLYVHKMASKEWLRYYLTDVADFSMAASAFLRFEDTKILKSPYVKEVLDNVVTMGAMAVSMYKEFFNESIALSESDFIPVVSFKSEDSNGELSIEDVIQILLSRFRTQDQFPSYIERLKYVGRLFGIMNNQALGYKEAISINYVKPSTFSGCSVIVPMNVTVLGESAAIDPTSAFSIPQEDIDAYNNDYCRNMTEVSWIKIVSMKDMLSLMKEEDNVKKDVFTSSAIGSSLGHFVNNHSELTPFTQEYITAKIHNRLNRRYVMDAFTGIRTMAAARQLSYASSCILKLAPNRKEGLIFGLEPDRKTVVTSSKQHIFDYVLTSIGLNSSMSMLVDRKFLKMVKNYNKEGGILTLTPTGESFLNANPNLPQLDNVYKISSLITIDDAKLKYDSNKSLSYHFYLRPEKIRNMIFQDTFRVNESSDYNVVFLEDGIVSSICTSVFDMSAIAIEHKLGIPITDTVDVETIKASILSICGSIEGFLFPIISPDVKKGSSDNDEDPDETKDDPEDVD